LLPTGSTIVDVGAGFGDLGLLAEADGSFRYIGFEPSVSVSRAARSRGVDLRPELFTAASLSGEADAIVLEHLNDPIAVLREARAALRSGCTGRDRAQST